MLYGVEMVDFVCVKLNELICIGKIDRIWIFYKFLKDVVEIYYNFLYEYDKEVIEFFNIIIWEEGRLYVLLEVLWIVVREEGVILILLMKSEWILEVFFIRCVLNIKLVILMSLECGSYFW